MPKYRNTHIHNTLSANIDGLGGSRLNAQGLNITYSKLTLKTHVLAVDIIRPLECSAQMFPLYKVYPQTHTPLLVLQSTAVKHRAHGGVRVCGVSTVCVSE